MSVRRDTDTSPEAVNALAFRLATIEAYPFTSAKETMQRGAVMIRALAAQQAQAAGRIRELEARLRAARYDDEIDDGDMDDEVTSGHCECGALHSEGTEEMDCGRCAACGGLI